MVYANANLSDHWNWCGNTREQIYHERQFVELKRARRQPDPVRSAAATAAPTVSDSDTMAKLPSNCNFYAFFSISEIFTLYKADIVQGVEHRLVADNQ